MTTAPGRLVVCTVAFLALVALSPRLPADTAVRDPAAPSVPQAMAAAKRLWSAIRAHDRARIGAAVAAAIHTRAALFDEAGKRDHELDVERARFAEKMRTLELGGEPATNWRSIEAPYSVGPGAVWVSADVESAAGVHEGHGARTATLSFGVRLVGGRALVVAFDAVYGESPLIFSR